MPKTWQTEAVRKAADIVDVALVGVTAAAAGVSALVGRPYAAAVAAALGTAGVVLTRVQAALARGKVWSKRTRDNDVLVATGRDHQPHNLVSLGDEDRGL